MVGSNVTTIKFVVSYGGRIAPRYPDAKLRYQGGDIRVLTVDRSISFLDLWTKMVEMCGTAMRLRCQLPNEDLDALVTITSDEDLINLIEEYDRAAATMAMEVTSVKIRAFLFSSKTTKKVSPTSSSSASSSTSITSPRSPFDSLNIPPPRLASAPGQCIRLGSKPPAYPVFTTGEKSSLPSAFLWKLWPYLYNSQRELLAIITENISRLWSMKFPGGADDTI